MLENTSLLNSVAFADDQTTLIVPAMALIPGYVEFSAPTYGMQSTCRSIMSKCIPPPSIYAQSVNCSSTIFKFIMMNITQKQPFGILNSSGLVIYPLSYNVNLKYVTKTFSEL
jgi:hypothetical protein